MDITFIITGHCMKRCPSDTSYIFKVIESLKYINNYNNSRTIISLDGVDGLHGVTDEHIKEYINYKNKIIEFIKNKPNFELITYKENLNLVGNIYETLKLVQTKYIFLIQQDLCFLREFDLKSILDDLDNLPNIKHLRFNDITNPIVDDENKIKANNIYTKIFCFGDRNHISRTEYYKEVIFKKVPYRKPKGWSYPCYGMENKLYYKPKTKHELYGTYLYGDSKHPPMIFHYRAGRRRHYKVK